MSASENIAELFYPLRYVPNQIDLHAPQVNMSHILQHIDTKWEVNAALRKIKNAKEFEKIKLTLKAGDETITK